MNSHLAPIAVPDPGLLPRVQELCDLTAPYATGPAEDELFAAAMAEINAWHADRSPFFRSLYESTGTDAAPPTAPRSCTRASSSGTSCSPSRATPSTCT